MENNNEELVVLAYVFMCFLGTLLAISTIVKAMTL
jgi:hypothetical protein